jgi:predicted nuclease of predicted toxin-antitoxin system
MRVLVDECLPRALKRLLGEHECRTVREMGWSGKTNGVLLSLAEAEFDVLITIDQAMGHQQNVADCKIALLVLSARSNQIEDLEPMIPAARVALRSIQPGQVVRVGE